MGKKSTPTPDPLIGQAALKSAKLGEKYLTHMMDQAEITNGWAAEDRERYMTVTQPLEDEYIAESKVWASPERKEARALEATADVRQQAEIARDAGARRLAAAGVDPSSGRSMETMARADSSEALAAAGAGNMARRGIEQEAQAMKANAINLGKGMAVNPATSMGLSNGATSAGFQGAMNGYGQQGQLLTNKFNMEMDAYNAKQSVMGGLGGALGSVIGAMPFMSTKTAKEKKRKVYGILDAVKAMPVEKWKYKEGMGDGGEHIGPYAEDFKAKTGLGNGKEISVIDALGVSMGAIKELAAKVDAMVKPKAGAPA